MPKVVLGEQNRRNTALIDYIDRRIGRSMKHKSRLQLAKAIKMSPSTIRTRYDRPGTFRFDDLCELFQATRITDKELAQIFGVEYKGRTKREDEG